MPVFVHLAVEICCNLIADNVAVENYKLEKTGAFAEWLQIDYNTSTIVLPRLNVVHSLSIELRC